MKITDLILLEDDDSIIINKPSGLLSIPDRLGKEISLKQILQAYCTNIFTVHRLDKDTSGVIIFAKNEKAHKVFSQQFEHRQTKKIYCGIVIGSPAQEKYTINAPIAEHPAQNGTMIVHSGGKEAITDYEVMEKFGIYSLLQFQIHTGRTHQIRVHAREMGHPIACDTLYGDGKAILLSSVKGKKFKLGKNVEEETPLLNQLALHAQQLSLQFPSGIIQNIEAPTPKNFKVCLQQLAKWRKGK